MILCAENGLEQIPSKCLHLRRRICVMKKSKSRVSVFTYFEYLRHEKELECVSLNADECDML